MKNCHKIFWLYCSSRRIPWQKQVTLPLVSHIFLVIIIFVGSRTFVMKSSHPEINKDNNSIQRLFSRVIPSNSFDLFWTVWNLDEAALRERRLIVIDSIFIHHPQATVIMLSSTLNRINLFASYRSRGYQIYCVHISPERLIQWKWYLSFRSKKFLTHLNAPSNTNSYLHMNDYVKVMSLYLYGGTFIDMDVIILQPLPAYEFIGLDRLDSGNNCSWCLKNRSGLYMATSLMRFRCHHTLLRQIILTTFNVQVYNAYCLDCTGAKAFTENFNRYQGQNGSGLANFKILEPYRLYPFMSKETSAIFHSMQNDLSLLSADLMKKSYALPFFGHISDKFIIKNDSLMGSLNNQLNLGIIRPKSSFQGQTNTRTRLIHRPVYIFTNRNQGRFHGHDAVYLKLDSTLARKNIKWNLNIHVSRGMIIYSDRTSLANLGQAQVNTILNKLVYKPNESTSLDTLCILLKSGKISINSSLTILVFSKWVTFLLNTIETNGNHTVIERMVTNVEKYFPNTTIHIASDLNRLSGGNYESLYLDSSNAVKRYRLSKNVFIFNIPEENIPSTFHDYFINTVPTPFFLLVNDNFTFEEYSHIDLLLELIYTYEHIDIIAEDEPDNRQALSDYSTLILRGYQANASQNGYAQSQRLLVQLSDDKKYLDETNPCNQIDFIPNVFMGRKRSMDSLHWYNFFKSVYDEMFFSQLYRANRTIYTCRYI
ncbi:unnamed protein product [Rotaria socialis]|uniref:Alpha 1,4-glycosyltransferase domain-containing protein n=1 Tax=Rotaria socialis TaxID=392032 RepID=A0A819TYH0_9BILA|nr:unnamed protein product [Rotaria socialis]CAF4085758.1 unnamed protein product [Rotaria socialis]